MMLTNVSQKNAWMKIATQNKIANTVMGSTFHRATRGPKLSASAPLLQRPAT